MARLKLSVQVVEVNLTADDWELFTSMDGADDVAEALNSSFKSLVNAGKSRDDVEVEMEKVMSEHSSFGAIDSEPLWMLRQLLTDVFGREE